MSLLVGAEVDGRSLDRDELLIFLLTLLVAGNETTRTLISGGTLALFEHPDQRADLVADPALIPGAVEECLRWVTPIQAFARTVTADTVIGGVEVKELDYLVMLYASGNRDERAFGPTADVFDIRRDVEPSAPRVRLRGAPVPGRGAGAHGDAHPVRGDARPAPELRRGRRTAVGSVEPRARNGDDAARVGAA